MPRPVKPVDAVRNCVLPPVRCSGEEVRRIKDKAARVGLSVSAYVRSVSLSGRIVMQESHRVDPAYVEQLRRIGVNLNQITKSVHERHGRVPLELLTVLDEINAVMEQAAEGV